MSVMERPAKLRVHIRWAIRRDFPFILEIENDSFEFPWPEEVFVEEIRGRNTIAMVAEYQGAVVGYFVYELMPRHIELKNFAVHPQARRRGVGKAMVDKLVSKLSTRRRTRIVADIRETNLDAQLFFRANGFRCHCIYKEHFNNDEDAYVFVYSWRDQQRAHDAMCPGK